MRYGATMPLAPTPIAKNDVCSHTITWITGLICTGAHTCTLPWGPSMQQVRLARTCTLWLPPLHVLEVEHLHITQAPTRISPKHHQAAAASVPTAAVVATPLRATSTRLQHIPCALPTCRPCRTAQLLPCCAGDTTTPGRYPCAAASGCCCCSTAATGNTCSAICCCCCSCTAFWQRVPGEDTPLQQQGRCDG